LTYYYYYYYSHHVVGYVFVIQVSDAHYIADYIYCI
jgi:hypothetical protein